MTGLRPVVEIMTLNFILVAMDQVVNHAALRMLGRELVAGAVRGPDHERAADLAAEHVHEEKVHAAALDVLDLRPERS
jgi:pyruvate dehydrogenase E1 component beta subunit